MTIEFGKVSFKKGDKAFILGSWNEKGVVYIREVLITSWGKKQATAEFLSGEGNLRHHIGTQHANTKLHAPQVLPIDADVEAYALELSRLLIADQLERNRDVLARNIEHNPDDTRHHDYWRGRIAELEAAEPSFIYYDQWLADFRASK